MNLRFLCDFNSFRYSKNKKTTTTKKKSTFFKDKVKKKMLDGIKEMCGSIQEKKNELSLKNKYYDLIRDSKRKHRKNKKIKNKTRKRDSSVKIHLKIVGTFILQINIYNIITVIK